MKHHILTIIKTCVARKYIMITIKEDDEYRIITQDIDGPITNKLIIGVMFSVFCGSKFSLSHNDILNYLIHNMPQLVKNSLIQIPEDFLETLEFFKLKQI